MSTQDHTLSNADRLRALEMADELSAKNERLYSLAAAIEDELSPTSNEESVNPTAWRLSELLSELLADMGQHNRLVDLLRQTAVLRQDFP
jgi:hypothetical protein